MTQLDEKTQELVCISASIASHCRHCFLLHYEKAKELQISDEDIKKVIELAMNCSRSGNIDMFKFTKEIMDKNKT